MALGVSNEQQNPRNSRNLGQESRIATRPVDDGDAQFLLQTYASVRREEIAMLSHWSEEQRQAFMQMQLLAQKTDYDARYPGSDHRIILLDDCSVGQIWIGRLAAEIRLLDIALLPEYRRQGIGTILLRNLQQEAKNRGKTLRHCLHKDNSKALSFYQNLDFSICAELGMHYLMEWNP